MRIGMAVYVDPLRYKGYFSTKDYEILLENCKKDDAPAVNNLVISLLKAGHFLRVFTFSKNCFYVASEQIEIIGVQQYSKRILRHIGGIFIDGYSLKKTISHYIDDLDILHAHWTYAYAFGVSFYESRLPVFCTVRDWAAYIWKMQNWKGKIIWTTLLVMNSMVFKHKKIHFIANSPYTAARIQKKYNLSVPVIPNAISNEFIKNEKHIYPEVPAILCISSSNDKRKNIIALLKAFSLFREKYKKAKLQLIGTPFTLDSSIVKRWMKNKLLDGVELLGKVNHNELKDYIDNSSLFVTPSLEETFGNTLIENQARRVPVIGGENSGAVPYVLHHGKAGFLCDVTNPVDIYDVMVDVYENQSEVRNITEYAFQVVTTEYSELTTCNQHIKLYEYYLDKK